MRKLDLPRIPQYRAIVLDSRGEFRASAMWTARDMPSVNKQLEWIPLSSLVVLRGNEMHVHRYQKAACCRYCIDLRTGPSLIETLTFHVVD